MALTLPTNEKGHERARVQPRSHPERLGCTLPGVSPVAAARSVFHLCPIAPTELAQLEPPAASSTLPHCCGELAQLEPPAASSTFCLPAEIHGIIARSSEPVFSIGWALPLARSALKLGEPAL